MAADYTPSELREMREALRAFQEAYVEYLRSPSPAAKAAAVRAMPEAELALLAGGGVVTFHDPPAMGPTRVESRGGTTRKCPDAPESGMVGRGSRRARRGVHLPIRE